MSTTRKTWIIAHDGTGEKPFGFECERCGCFEKTELPLSIPEFLKAAREFIRKHKYCPESN